MSTDIVKISNKSYSIPQTLEDRARRRIYFNTYDEKTDSAKQSLKPEESEVLKDLGMSPKMINSLKMYLPTFFDNLESCSSDSSLILNQKCNIPYYVLWSIMLANKEKTDERIRKEKLTKSSIHLLGTATDSSLLAGLQADEVKNEYDKLFQLILINLPKHSAVAPSTDVTDSTDLGKLLQLTDDKDGAVNKEFASEIDNLFKLILVRPIDKLAAELIKLVRDRRPHYTFSQLGSTCATDSLFTILLQSDKIKDLFIQNMVSLYKSENNKLVPINNALHYALKRYINMLTIESSDTENKSTRIDSVNLDRENPYGELILKEISQSEACVGATRGEIIKYLTGLKAQLQSIIPNINLLNFFYGQAFRENYDNLSTINALYITHPTVSSSDEKTGHAVSIIKINNEWYISDNEVGLLHKVNDPQFITILFEKLNEANNNPKHEICQMWRTTEEQKAAQNLLYFFVFKVGGKQYIYPKSNVPGNKDSNTPIVTAERTIVFKYTEQQ